MCAAAPQHLLRVQRLNGFVGCSLRGTGAASATRLGTERFFSLKGFGLLKRLRRQKESPLYVASEVSSLGRFPRTPPWVRQPSQSGVLKCKLEPRSSRSQVSPWRIVPGAVKTVAGSSAIKRTCLCPCRPGFGVCVRASRVSGSTCASGGILGQAVKPWTRPDSPIRDTVKGWCMPGW